MRRVQIIATVVVAILLLVSTFFVYNKQNTKFEFQTKPVQQEGNEPNAEKVIMGVMGNQTEK